MDKTFKQFLKENRAYSKFIWNIILQSLDWNLRASIKRLSHTARYNTLGAAFVWKRSPQGQAFWSNLQNEWNKQRSSKLRT